MEKASWKRWSLKKERVRIPQVSWVAVPGIKATGVKGWSNLRTFEWLRMKDWKT